VTAPATPLISVVIPCYNHGMYVGEAIESVLAQTVQNFEILVVDDGSTDEATRKLLASAAWPRTQVFRTENRGLAAARNFLIERSRGQFLCALDADDKLHPQYLEKTLGQLERDPALTFVSTRLQMFGDEDRLFPADTRCDLPTLLADCPVFSAALVRRAAVDAVGGYDEAMLQGDEDWDLWISLLEAGGHGVILPDVLFYYRRRRGSMCDLCTRGDTHLKLIEYLVRKHQSSYRAHVLDVLRFKDRQQHDLGRENDRLEEELDDSLRPTVERKREELQHLQTVLASAGSQGAATAGEAEAELVAAQNELAALRAEYDRSIAEVGALRSSGSWRLTAPLRALYDLVRGKSRGEST